MGNFFHERRRAQNSDSICKTRSWKKNVSRPKYTYSNQSWRFRCAAGYLCQLNPFNSSTIQIFLGDSVKTGFWKGFFDAFTTGGWIYCIIFAILIILFAFFYVTIQYNPVEIANNLRQNNGSIPGIRPGKPTSDYIAKFFLRLPLSVHLFLAVIRFGTNRFTHLLPVCTN